MDDFRFPNWIWLDSDRFPAYQTARISTFAATAGVSPAMAVFRSTLHLDRVPEQAPARFTGDSKYRLYLNGQFIDDGPVEVGGDYGNAEAPDWWFHDERDLAPFLRVGENVLVAEVFTSGFAQTDYSTGHPGFAFAADLGNDQWWLSGEDWLSLVHPGSLDPDTWRADRYAADYHAAGFAVDGWFPAVRLGPAVAARWRLKKLDIPPLSTTTLPPEAVEIPFAAHRRWIDGDDEFLAGAGGLTLRLEHSVCFYLRYPREVAAHLEWDVETSAPIQFTFEYQEYPGITHHTERYRSAVGRQVFRTPRLNAFHYVMVRADPCGFSLTPATATFHRIVAHDRAFPVPPTAPFACSDPGLEKIRALCDRTLRLCMQRLHLDSPVHQEGLGCTGDYRIEALMAQALYGETRLAAADLRRTALLLRQKDGVMFHTSYTLLFVEMLRDAHLYGADETLLTDCFPEVERVLERFSGYLGSEGLVSEAPNYMFIDWVEDGGFNYHHPPASRGMGAMTAFFHGALLAGAELGEWHGAAARAEQWRALAGKIRMAFHTQLWDEERGCYRDGLAHLTRIKPSTWLPADDGRISYSVHTNTLALACGLTPEPLRSDLLRRVMTDDTLVPAQMYFMHYLFEAIHRQDAFEHYGHELLRRWHDAVKAHPEGLKEAWYGGDASHAWGGTPAYQVTRSVLGVEPIKPGFACVRLSPRPGNLSRVAGEIPTPHGTIGVEGDAVRTVFTLPTGMSYEAVSAGRVIEIRYRQ